MCQGKRLVVGLAVLASGLAYSPAVRADGTAGQADAASAGDPAVSPLRISMDFQDASLKDVLKTFSQQTGINVIALEGIGEKRVTLYLEDVEALDALDQILKAGNLMYERPAGSGIYLIRPKEKDAALGSITTITRVYKLKYARVSESNLAKAATAFGASTPFEGSLSAVSGGGSSGGGQSGGSSGGGSQRGAPAAAGSSQSGGGSGAGIDLVIRRLLTEHGSLVVDGRTNNLIVTDIPGNFARLEAALAALDVRTPQILVDAELIETTLTKLKDFGVEWGNGTEGNIFSFKPATRTTYFPFSGLASVFPGNQGLTSSGLTKTGPTAGSYQFGTLASGSALAVLQALETDSDTKILARPKVLTLDNESAVIRLTSNETIGFESSSQATTAVQSSTPERELTGVVLVVTPQVNDQQNITMIVEPSVTKTVASSITPPSGSAQTRDPKTRSSRTLVRIRSGDTLVVGGLIDRSQEHSLSRVPFLSSIPVFGEAFKDRETNNSETELVVFVTPRILSESTETQVASAALPGGATSPVVPSAAPASMGMHEQEQASSRQDLMEDALNRLEAPAR